MSTRRCDRCGQQSETTRVVGGRFECTNWTCTPDTGPWIVMANPYGTGALVDTCTYGPMSEADAQLLAASRISQGWKAAATPLLPPTDTRRSQP